MLRSSHIISLPLTVLLTLSSLFFYSQCSISGLSPTYCLNSANSNLSTNFIGGQINGPGVSNSVFQPSIAGVGTHTLTYAYCSLNYTLQTDSFIPFAYNPTNVYLGDNEMSQELPIGFTFKFFCDTFSTFYISSNGFITFSSQQSNGCCQGEVMPTTNAGSQNIIACAWTDLDPSAGGNIRYALMGIAPNRVLLVSFNCIFHKTGQAPVTSEILLHESSNLIEICTTIKSLPSGPTIYPTTMGIQDGKGHAKVVPYRNGTSSWTASNEIIRFIPGPDCVTTQTTLVHANPNIAIVASNTYICRGEQVLLNASGASSYSWSTQQTGISITVSPNAQSNYSVTGYNDEGCSSTSEIQVKVASCTGIDENMGDVDFVVYPNPNDGEFRINSKSEFNVFIYTYSGRLVKNIQLSEQNNYEERLLNLPEGIYFLSAQNNQTQVIKKIIILK